jgi:hypothetical protein
VRRNQSPIAILKPGSKKFYLSAIDEYQPADDKLAQMFKKDPQPGLLLLQEKDKRMRFSVSKPYLCPS